MLGSLAARSPRRVLAIAGLVFAALATIGAGTIDALSLNRYEATDAESTHARDVLADRFGTGSPNVAILVSPDSGTVDDDTASVVGQRLTDALAADPDVADAWSYWSPSAPDTLASEDRRHALVLAYVPGDADHVRGDVLPRLEEDVIAPRSSEGVDLQLGGGDAVFQAVAERARTDFLRAEMVVIPLVLVLLWIVYRRLPAALATLAVGLFTVVGSLAILRGVTAFTDVSTFASNIALVMGIGLGIDYGLFMTYRFREELVGGRDPATAIRLAVVGAGRTITFSAATVAAGVAVLLVFPFPFLQSFAYAGIAVALTAVAGSVLVLPSILVLLGHRVARRSDVEAAPERSFWGRTASRVMRRPVAAGVAGLTVLLALGAPALAIEFGSPDDRIMTSDEPVRGMYDTIRADFSTEDADALRIAGSDADLSDLPAYAADLSRLDGVERVDSAAGAYVDGTRAAPTDAQRYVSPPEGDTSPGTWLAVVPTAEELADGATGLVQDVRAVDAPFETLVGGYPAELADYRDGVVDRLPLAAALIMAVTFVILFVMTGSVVAPVKAALLNLLSLTVMFGVLVWGFQEGALSDLLGFTTTGSIEPSIPILMFCIAYGLSMDYEVFLLSRIKEDYDVTGDVNGSVVRGIGRSAPLVTAAALILAASFAVYATGSITFLQQMGIGMALAVAVDATVIRGVLVPAFMQLAGRANWWAPPLLRRLHDRIGVREDARVQERAR